MDDVWKLLKEYDFQSKNKIIDFACILCKKILIDARVGPCGCRFCKICIENYLNNGDNICPGSTSECKEENLNLSENINIDHATNRKIAKLKLNCPIESCTFSDQIINMKQHLIGCREIAIKCPLSENGCNFISLIRDNVDKHYEISKDKHLEIVLLKIGNMKNVIDLINKNKIELQQENEKLKSENDNQINKLKQNQEIITDWQDKYNQMNCQHENLEKQIDDYKSKYENEIKSKSNMINCLSEYLMADQTEFIWKIKNFSDIKIEKKTVYSDEFFIYLKTIRMQMTLCYDSCNCYHKLNVNISYYNPLWKDFQPTICDINVGIINEISQNFILSFSEKKKFNSSGVSFEIKLDPSQISDRIIDNSITVKCLVKFSL